jgi:uncharacterized protein (DUF1697 family)
MKMADLSDLYKSLGFLDSETYIQSGNVIFTDSSERVSSEISAIIESAIFQRFNYNIPVIIRTAEVLKELISSNPFIDEEKFEPSKMAVIFLYEKATESQIQKIVNVSYPPDKFKVAGLEIFIFCPNGFGKSKLYTNFFENKMGVVGTARNWKTITTIISIAENRM